MTEADPQPSPEQTASPELSQLQDQMLRLQADFENARKRWVRQQAEIQEAANAQLLRELLDVYDDFQRAISLGPAAQETNSVMTGVGMIAKRLEELFKSYGVQPMDAMGKPFDATLHEAVAHEATPLVAESTVLAELRKGYLMNGRVLRPAVVKVATP